ncbi:M4 family metallopeptidase [Nocardioides sp. InS609-2]|uniref:M4 family metallopeptidase n=1 Tax=Nocardioides sp. InS609-2 TaxID=2760705 RepID=UPI0024A60DFB|nr:M4 family metallopeptidase [Nocardioides sp. InS609-2]
MKFLRQGIALAVAGAGLAAIPAMQVQAQAAEPSLVQQMKNQAQGATSVSDESATGRVGFIRVSAGGDLMPARDGASTSAAADKASAYLDKYAAGFGAGPGELEQAGVVKDSSGWTVTYTQDYNGVPVFGSTLRAHVDKQGDLTAVNGYAAPGLSLSTTPRLDAVAAAERAVGTVRQDPPGHEDERADTTGIEAAKNDLVVYRTGATKGVVGKASLAYVVEVSNGANIRDMVFIDAQTGKMLNRYSMVHDALDRELYEATGTPAAPVLTKVWKEGDPFPGTLNQDQQNEVDGTGDAYWFFKNGFNRDSYDNAGHKMVTVNNDPRIRCPNANWNGATTNYCSGVSSDDVVAHEWGHAYTEYTHDLIYQYQSGALNESYSDIWGETVDLINGKQDAGEGDLTAKRPDGQCSKYTRSDISMVINSPAGAAGPCTAVAAAFGPVFDQAGVTSDIVVAVDPVEPAVPGPPAVPAGTANDGCSAYTNASAVAGKFAYVDRGGCSFGIKADRAAAAGATGIIVGDNAPGRAPISMSGSANIYGAMVTQSNGARIKTAGTVNATIKDAETDPKADSYRWLIGEKSTAFGGAIRDMWNPTCYGDPGKVSDAEYFCGTADGGGVHSNSGVPNHGYSLLVDGGSYNGQSVSGIGLDKAAAIYFRAMTQYQTPTSDFVDHADSLAASCTDLIGQPINQLTIARNATPTPATPITAADCTQVAAMSAAVELRVDPTDQCGYKPLFDKNTPALCGPGFKENTVWSEDFEDGLAGWTASQEIVFAGGIGAEWKASSTAPGNHPGGVAFGPAPDKGTCSSGAGDFSSRDSITGPVIELPASDKLPRMSFDQYVATENGYDGGNLKVSVNGSEFTALPAASYTFNAPVTLTGSATNTSPLAGEPGFTGTDGGKLNGSWGTSHVELSRAGVKPGDLVQFRFDIGRDGCGGLDGWYVDNVKLVTCKIKAKVSAAHLPEPSTFGQASSVKVTVDRDGTVGAAPTGSVTLTKADGTAVGSGTLANGSAMIALPADLAVGVYTMKANYSGNDTIAPETGTVTVTVKSGPGTPPTSVGSSTHLKVKPRHPTYTQNIKGVAKVMADNGSDVTGKVKFLLDGKKVRVISLDNGRAVIKIKKDLKIGKHKLVAVYTGSDTIRRSRDKVPFEVRRR